MRGVCEGLKVLALCSWVIGSGLFLAFEGLIMYIMLTLGGRGFLNDFIGLRAGGRV